MFENSDQPRNRVFLGIALAVVIVLGLGSRKFGEFLPTFLAAHSGDVLWTVAVYLSLAMLAPKWSLAKLGLLAFGISVAVELSQLVDLDWLNAIRKTLPGRLLLGSVFLWIDLLRYFTGAVLATVLDWLCTMRSTDRGRSR